MPANDGRHVPSHHHARIRIISAGAAAIITLALAAYTATTAGSASTSSPAPPAASSGGPAATLTGSGSTFDAPFFDLAFARYHHENAAVAIGYSAVGSSAATAGYVPLPPQIQQLARSMLQQVTGPDGARLLS